MSYFWNVLFAPIFVVAHWIMPPEKREWSKAICAECIQSHSFVQRVALCLGLLSTAFSERARADGGLAWIGQRAIAVALASLATLGLSMSGRMAADAASAVALACVVYAVIGLSALRSLTTLGTLARIAFSMFAVLAVTVRLAVPQSAAGDLYFALLVEGMALMTVLIIAARILPQLVWSRANEL